MEGDWVEGIAWVVEGPSSLVKGAKRNIGKIG